MDLEQFEADARAAFATGKYRLVCGQFGTGPSNCCLLLMVLLHRDPPARPTGGQLHCDLLSHLYGGDTRAWYSLVLGFDGVTDTAGHRQAHALGARLAKEFKPTRRAA